MNYETQMNNIMTLKLCRKIRTLLCLLRKAAWSSGERVALEGCSSVLVDSWNYFLVTPSLTPRSTGLPVVTFNQVMINLTYWVVKFKRLHAPYVTKTAKGKRHYGSSSFLTVHFWSV